MQINFRLLPVLTLAVFTTFTACKKDSKPATDSTTELATHADDQNQVSNQMDIVANDASMAIESSTTYSGARGQSPPFTVCDATLTLDSTSNPRKATITYLGTSCSGAYKRTGTVVVSMPANVQWKNQGATITVTYQNFKVTRLADNKSVTINGSHTITNVSGGLLFMLPTIQSVTHTVSSSGMSITFDDGSQRTWQVATRREFTYSNNAVVLTITGNNSNGTTDGIAEWGTNRFGHSFTSTITEPLVIRSDCYFRLTSGQVKHEGSGTATATFGLDASGNATSCPGQSGHYYFKLTWTGPNGASASAILPY
jgi:hypothetical protein